MKTFRAGVDIGGTFTDIVLLGDRGERHTKKVSSTVDDYARAITEGLSQLLAEIDGEARGSAEVLPVINEYERSSTTVINGYVRPIVERYLNRLAGEVKRIGIDAPLLLMQSNGGLTTANAAAVTPMHIIESGPAAGVVGVQALTRLVGIDKAISFDMGGTTAKASLIENGELTRATEYQVGAGIVLGSRLLSGAGYTLKVPAIDLAEVGAGGGSI